MLLNMVMFKVTICDFGKMNINMTDKIEKKGMKKMSSKKTNLQNSNGEKSYYKSFMLYCIILLVGIFLPEKLGVHYLNFNFISLVSNKNWTR